MKNITVETIMQDENTAVIFITKEDGSTMSMSKETWDLMQK